jgi:hypothetical protein
LEIGGGEDGAPQVCLAQVCCPEVCTAQVRVAEVGSAKPKTGQTGAFETVGGDAMEHLAGFLVSDLDHAWCILLRQRVKCGGQDSSLRTFTASTPPKRDVGAAPGHAGRAHVWLEEAARRQLLPCGDPKVLIGKPIFNT